MILLVYSVAMILFGQQRLSKFTTIFGLARIVGVLFYIESSIRKQTDELHYLVNENLGSKHNVQNSSETTEKDTKALEDAKSLHLRLQSAPEKQEIILNCFV